MFDFHKRLKINILTSILGSTVRLATQEPAIPDSRKDFNKKRAPRLQQQLSITSQQYAELMLSNI